MVKVPPVPLMAVDKVHCPAPSVVQPPDSPDDHRPTTYAEVTLRWSLSWTTTVTVAIDDPLPPCVLVPSRSPTCIDPGWTTTVLSTMAVWPASSTTVRMTTNVPGP